ncbi:MAG: DEAD/DEAH box helicase [Treponema sp.]|jgi:superfamily II DNA/RNA helicase|nr:DEAD/DEAH box helicase [Treponema sp.]
MKPTDPAPSNPFIRLGVSPPLAEILSLRNIREPAEIQKTVIPRLLFPGDEASPERAGGGSGRQNPAADEERRDARANLLFSSPTGTGKTLAYLLPLLQRFHRPSNPQAALRILILAPTYELASQIKRELDALLPGAFSGASLPHAALLIGSVPLNRQIESLKKHRPLAAAGNPARVLQLVKMKKLSLKGLEYLILDEGDRLMAEELFPETAEICRLAQVRRESGPDEVQPLRFIACSATFSEKNRNRLFSLSPGTEWEIIAQKENDILKKSIKHWAFFACGREKISALRSFIAAVKPAKALVFSSRAGQVGQIVSKLQYHHLAAAGLSGDMDKRARKSAIDAFRRGSVNILVASDLAARGLDIEGISHIIALDTADSAEAYVHRAGRTARAGKRGVMATFGDEEELTALAGIEKKLGIVIYPKVLYRGRVCEPEPITE